MSEILSPVYKEQSHADSIIKPRLYVRPVGPIDPNTTRLFAHQRRTSPMPTFTEHITAILRSSFFASVAVVVQKTARRESV